MSVRASDGSLVGRRDRDSSRQPPLPHPLYSEHLYSEHLSSEHLSSEHEPESGNPLESGNDLISRFSLIPSILLGIDIGNL
jgi:hypothetical protein